MSDDIEKIEEQPNQEERNQPERRQDRRQEREREQQQKATRSENAAPAGMFRKQAGADTASNPERVKIIKAQIADYAAKCGVASGDTKDTQLATSGLVTAVRNMFTLNNGELRGIFDTLVNAIKNDKAGAFAPTILYRYANGIKTTADRETFVGVLDLLTCYVRLEDPTKIRAMKDVEYALRHVKNEAAAKAFAGFFPSK
jgi:hypothetical protein